MKPYPYRPWRNALASRLATSVAAIAALLIVTHSPSVAAVEFTAEQKAQIGVIVHEYLVKNPEVVREAVEELEKREKLAENETRKKVVADNSGKLFNSANQAVVGNPDGDVTLVEFFDYNCGFCKQSMANVAKLIEADPKLRVVLKDFPVLGPDSVEVAQIATALHDQFKGQKFWEFHRKVLGTRGHVGKAQALAVAKELGADVDKLERDMKSPAVSAGLQETAALADSLKFNGTPSWIVGKDAFVGGLPYAEMKGKIDSLRKCGKTVC